MSLFGLSFSFSRPKALYQKEHVGLIVCADGLSFPKQPVASKDLGALLFSFIY